jgi:hypothetical protein
VDGRLEHRQAEAFVAAWQEEHVRQAVEVIHHRVGRRSGQLLGQEPRPVIERELPAQHLQLLQVRTARRSVRVHRPRDDESGRTSSSAHLGHDPERKLDVLARRDPRRHEQERRGPRQVEPGDELHRAAIELPHLREVDPVRHHRDRVDPNPGEHGPIGPPPF